MAQVEPLLTEGMTKKMNIKTKFTPMCEYCDNHIIDVESRPSDKLAVLTDENKWNTTMQEAEARGCSGTNPRIQRK
jgi:hypothetical protein